MENLPIKKDIEQLIKAQQSTGLILEDGGLMCILRCPLCGKRHAEIQSITTTDEDGKIRQYIMCPETNEPVYLNE